MARLPLRVSTRLSARCKRPPDRAGDRVEWLCVPDCAARDLETPTLRSKHVRQLEQPKRLSIPSFCCGALQLFKCLRPE
jgi:hypothetical protein